MPYLIARVYELGRGRTAGEETGTASWGLEGGNVSWARAGDQQEEAGTWDMSSFQRKQALG